MASFRHTFNNEVSIESGEMDTTTSIVNAPPPAGDMMLTSGSDGTAGQAFCNIQMTSTTKRCNATLNMKINKQVCTCQDYQTTLPCMSQLCGATIILPTNAHAEHPTNRICFTQGVYIALTGSVPLKKFVHSTFVPTFDIFVFADLKVCHLTVRL